jgi:hypothetical protein
MDTTALTSLSATTASGIATTTTAPPPLTTTFTPSPWCLTDLYLLSTKEPSGEDCPNGYCSWTHLGPSSSASACFPTGWGPTSYFSPGLCPSGYTEGCGRSLTTVDGSITEYRATCCPRYILFNFNFLVRRIWTKVQHLQCIIANHYSSLVDTVVKCGPMPRGPGTRSTYAA